jgi:RND family efflux transporter MFP subunit
MSKFKFFTTKIGIAVLIAAAAGGIAYVHFSAKPAPNLVTVTRGDIRDEVLVTGSTKPVKNIDLAFAHGGTITRVYVDVGAKVSPGQPLVELDVVELSAQLREAQANTASAQAKLDALKRGSRPEDIQITQTQIDKAEQDLANDYNGVLAILFDAYAKSDDAIRNQINAFFTGADTESPQLVFSVNDSQIQTDVQSGRLLAGNRLDTWKDELSALNTTMSSNSSATLDNALTNAQTHLTLMLTFLGKTMDAIVNSITLSSATITSYKTNVTTARNEVTVAITNVNSIVQTIASQKIVIQQSKDQLALQRAGSSEEDVRAQQALVDQTMASAAVIEAQLSQTVLRSPIAGTVTKQDAKVGGVAQASQSLVSIISADNLEIISNIPEVDIGKIELNDPAIITFDAFPGEKFSGKVVEIDPAETILDGVVNFQITTILDTPNSRLKSGLTANLEIETKKKTGVLIVPSAAVIQNDSGTFVNRYENGITTQIPVTLGIRDQGGNVEIVSGVNEGERLVNVGLKTN